MEIGVDIVEIHRIAKQTGNARFLKRVFTPQEVAYCRSRKNSSQHFAVRFAAKLKMWKGEIRGEGHKTFGLTPSLEPRLQLDVSTFNLWFETASPGPSGHSPAHRMSAATVLRAWQDGASLVPLTDGGWAPLPLSWLQRFGHRVARAGFHRQRMEQRRRFVRFRDHPAGVSLSAPDDDSRA